MVERTGATVATLFFHEPFGSLPRMNALAGLLAVALLAASPGEVRVFAAASLSRVFASDSTVVAGSPVVFNFAGSQQLALQLSQGASADVFASADERWMADAEKNGLLAGPAEVFARNRLVVITPIGDPGKIAGLDDLSRKGLKIVLAADAVPAGRYSREALAKLETNGLGAGYETAVLANVVSEEENVEAVVSKVLLGEADAGIVYVSDTLGDRRAKLRTIEIPAASNVTATYVIAALKSAPNPVGARAFIDWILTGEGHRLLLDKGFLAPR